MKTRNYKYLIKQQLLLRGFDEQDIDSYFNFIHAPDSLPGFKRVVTYLNYILPFLSQLTSQVRPGWLRCNAILFEHFDSIFPDYEEAKRRLFHGFLKKYPFYCVLGHSFKNRDYQQCYIILQAHVIAAKLELLQLVRKKQKKYDAVIGAATLAIRQLNTYAHLHSYVMQLPSSLVSRDDYLTALDSIIGAILVPGKDEEKLRAIYNLIDYARGERGGYQKKRIQNTAINVEEETTQQKQPIYQQRYIPAIETSTGEDNINLIKTYNAPKEKRAYEEYGCTAKELTKDPDFVESGRPAQEVPHPFAHIKRKRQLKNHIAMSNQSLHTAYDRLTPSETATFLGALNTLVNKNNQAKRTFGPPNTELAAILSVGFWTSSPLERTVHAVRLNQRHTFKKNSKCQLAVAQNCSVWLIKGILPKYAKDMDKSGIRAHLEERFPHSTLQIPKGVQQILRKWERTLKRNDKKLFNRTTKQYESAISKFLKSLKEKRITSQRISNHLFNECTHLTTDITDASVMFALPHHAASIPLYYYSVSLSELNTRYKTLCLHVIDQFHQETDGKATKDQFSVHKEPEENYQLGGRLGLKPHVVSGLRQNLVRYFNNADKYPGESGYFQQAHNYFTLYSLALAAYATGYRAIKAAFYSVTQIDFDTSFVGLSDKDSDDYYHSRLVYLPPVCLQQFRTYLEHRRALVARLYLQNAASAEKLQQDDDVPFIFLLTGDGTIVPPGPTHMKRVYAQLDFPLPPNIHRHHLRTQLRQRGCPGEIVNFLMGHWEYGQEPHGRYASLSPVEYQSIASQYLVPILEADGWQTVGGFA